MKMQTDEEGYLLNHQDWNQDIAINIAQGEGIQLTDAHWEVIDVIRTFYTTYELSPAMRPLVKAVGLQLGKDKGRSIYLMQLFPESPAKVCAKIAGLPKPANCL